MSIYVSDCNQFQIKRESLRITLVPSEFKSRWVERFVAENASAFEALHPRFEDGKEAVKALSAQYRAWYQEQREAEKLIKKGK